MRDARCLGCLWLFWPGGGGGAAMCLKDDGRPCDRPPVRPDKPKRRRAKRKEK